MSTVTTLAPKIHMANAWGLPMCGRKPMRFLPYTTDDYMQVTCRKCQNKVSKLERKDSTVSTFTETPEVVETTEDGMPLPRDTEHAIGWVVSVLFTDENHYEGVVKEAGYSDLKVLFPGGCPNSCCLTKIAFKQANFVRLAECELCDSGLPGVLCLCDDDLPPEGQAGEIQPPKAGTP